MIAGVVATIDKDHGNLRDVIGQIGEIACVETGRVSEGSRRIPITIDSPLPSALEATTRRIQGCHGVAFVDVVFVHFEDGPEQPAAELS